MSEWKKLGSIVLCQIHTDRMMHDGGSRDELLTEVDSLWLSPDGVVDQVGEQRTPEDNGAPHRAFLDDGMSGFIVGLANHTKPVDIAVGDEFWIRV